MAGASSNERKVRYIKETEAGTTPSSSPAFTVVPADAFSMTLAPRLTERFAVGRQGQRTGLTRAGVTVNGTMSGGFITGVYDDFLESLLQGAWSSDTLKNSNAQKTFTFEEIIPQGAGETDLHYVRYQGVECTAGNISLTAGGDATVDFTLLGSSGSNVAAAKLTGATENAAAATVPLGSGSDISSVTMSGLTLDCLQSLNIAFNFNGRDEQPQVGSDSLCGISRGGFAPVITGRFYIEDNFDSVYNNARSGTVFETTVTLGKTTNKKTKLTFYSCQFTQAPLVTDASGPAFQDFTIMAYYNDGVGKKGICKIDRNVA